MAPTSVVLEQYYNVNDLRQYDRLS